MARYVLDFGSVSGGLTPTWVVYQDLVTRAPLAPPTIYPNPTPGAWTYYFDYDFPPGTTAIEFAATCNATGLSDVLNSPLVLAAQPSNPVLPGTGTTTLGAVRAVARQRVGMEGSEFITDAEWNGYINASLQELYGLLVQAFGNDYYTATPYRITTDGVSERFPLPSDFFKLLGVDLKWPGSASGWTTLQPFNFQERNQNRYGGASIPAAGQTLQIHYAPRIGALVADADGIDGVNGWEEYIIVDACVKALAKEESDVSVYAAQKAALTARITAEAENRDAGMPATVTDIREQGLLPALRYRLNGNQLWLRQTAPLGPFLGWM